MTPYKQKSIPLISIEHEEKLIKEKKFSSVYILVGEENFLADEFINIISQNTIEENSLNFEIFSNDEIEFETIFLNANQISLSSGLFFNESRKVIVIRNFEIGRKKKNEETFFNYIENPSPNTILVLHFPKLDTKTEIAKKISEQCKMISCKKLSEEYLIDWIEKAFRKKNKTISKNLCYQILTYIGNSLNDINNAVLKIILYVNHKHVIEESDIVAQLKDIREKKIFELENAIGNKDIKTSIFYLYQLMDAGESCVKIVAFLSNYFLRGLNLKNSWMPHPTKYSMEEIQTAISILLEIDVNLKTIATTNEKKIYIMTNLIYRIINQNKLSFY